MHSGLFCGSINSSSTADDRLLRGAHICFPYYARALKNIYANADERAPCSRFRSALHIRAQSVFIGARETIHILLIPLLIRVDYFHCSMDMNETDTATKANACTGAMFVHNVGSYELLFWFRFFFFVVVRLELVLFSPCANWLVTQSVEREI